MVLEYAPNGNLFNYINRKRNLPIPEIKKLFFQTVIAIEYLHQKEIILRDLKPENLLLDKDMNIKSRYFIQFRLIISL
jgi:serine/threonine protein kinase